MCGPFTTVKTESLGATSYLPVEGHGPPRAAPHGFLISSSGPKPGLEGGADETGWGGQLKALASPLSYLEP